MLIFHRHMRNVTLALSLLAAAGPAWAERPVVAANAAQQPILGGLGVQFGKPPERVGGELEALALMALPDNRDDLKIPDGVPGALLPWRVLPNASLPRRFREHASRAYVMLDERDRVIRALAVVDGVDCDGADVQWLREVLVRKYGIRGDLNDLAEGPITHHRIISSDHQIDARCEASALRLDYGDYGALQRWASDSRARLRAHLRVVQEADEQHLILKRRRAVRLADRFTLGGGHRLHGGFGVRFREPFAPKGTLPTDEPIEIDLPSFDPKFDEGKFTIELDPEMRPITLRGRFEQLSFDELANALNAKYGGAMKSSDRHVVHKVSDYHIVLRAFPNRTEVAFIDSNLRRDQQRRRWEAESEGV